MKEGKVLLRKGYGLAKVEDKQVIRPEFVFRLGSITKQFSGRHYAVSRSGENCLWTIH